MGHIVSGNVHRRRPYKTGSIGERGPRVHRLRVVVKDPSTHRLIRRSRTARLREQASGWRQKGGSRWLVTSSCASPPFGRSPWMLQAQVILPEHRAPLHRGTELPGCQRSQQAGESTGLVWLTGWRFSVAADAVAPFLLSVM